MSIILSLIAGWIGEIGIWLGRSTMFKWWGSIYLEKLGFLYGSVIEFANDYDKENDKYVVVDMLIENKRTDKMVSIKQFDLRAISPKNLIVRFAKVRAKDNQVYFDHHSYDIQLIPRRINEFLQIKEVPLRLNPGEQFFTKICIEIKNLTCPAIFEIVMKDTSNKEYKAKVKIENKNGQFVLS